mmetsp:Transcript_41050/g.101286  ORF Transcript_41050/g.101286 Transcript_41050/m.101286 type:complete len:221 (+) Transcript_41050:849-1511(+)
MNRPGTRAMKLKATSRVAPGSNAPCVCETRNDATSERVGSSENNFCCVGAGTARQVKCSAASPVFLNHKEAERACPRAASISTRFVENSTATVGATYFGKSGLDALSATLSAIALNCMCGKAVAGLAWSIGVRGREALKSSVEAREPPSRSRTSSPHSEFAVVGLDFSGERAARLAGGARLTTLASFAFLMTYRPLIKVPMRTISTPALRRPMCQALGSS